VWPPFVLLAVNEMPNESAEEEVLRPVLDAGLPVLLDSGIFWLTSQHMKAHRVSMETALALSPEEIDGFAELYERYVQLVRRYGDRLWGYIELDQGGAVNKRRTRARLEAEGLAPIPVYHPLNDGWDYFDELAAGYDRMCVGNTVSASHAVRLRLLYTIWERRRAYPDLWVHILGLTANEWILSAPPDSCDSSTWLSPLRWPTVNTESAMLHKTPDLGPQFSYHLGKDKQAGRERVDAFNLCAESVLAMNLVWEHATRAVTRITGLSPYPPYLPGEKITRARYSK
jgi:hypothetical protein